MATLTILLLANVIACSTMVIYHAGCSRGWWASRSAPRRVVPQAELAESIAAPEFGDYVHQGLEELTVMLAQAARRRPS